MLRRAWRILFGRKRSFHDTELVGLEHVNCATSTILLPGSSVDFRVGSEDRPYVTIGERCMIGAAFIFETRSGQVSIGNNVHLGRVNFICRSRIEIADHVTMAWGITLYDHDSHSTSWEYRKNDNVQCYSDYHTQNGNNIVNKDWTNVPTKPIIIGPRVWVGFNVIILKGVTIGEGAVLGAGSVVTRDVPPYCLAVGNPARVVKRNL